ncbi:MAG TPA: sigma-54-dependent Fis family transcriptional regulator [candidate division WOR-3 bacterium]|uniref:Sigma-54-dependent Fis family transcriptional regulator n=1 Tax=candidate division WOR-3 bacterium TaxID=2052148 RepID=A0A9C9EN64_UNCW3|nr:sigma-54-dependent Fis family transcriptional regulator [candidate division WOR-3 bacterium]
MADVLIVEDKTSFGEMLKGNLEDAEISVAWVRRGREALQFFKKEKYEIALIDLRLPDIDGIDLLRQFKKFDTDTKFIIMTAFGSIEKAVEAMKLGAYDFITKPFDIEQLINLLSRLLKEQRCFYENIILREETEKLHGFQIIGRSAAIKKAAELLQKAAPTDATVLLLGESGTGKELFARACHMLSNRKENPFVPINCAAIPRELLENELFGSEKGAFTGATARKLGKFELANKGTIFLDEIGDLDLDLQAKILRVLQEKSFERLGGTCSIKVDVRVIAASNKDLLKLVRGEKFREDLYYRLSVFPITIPALRERKEDIPLLVEHNLKRLHSPKKISEKALLKLQDYDWPGNIRELENTIERAVILAGDIIKPEHILLPETKVSFSDLSGVQTLRRAAEQGRAIAEAALIKRTLLQTGGNKSEAARRLEISYKTLLNRIKEYKKKGYL